MATSSMIGPILEGEFISYLYSLLSHSYSYWMVSSYSYSYSYCRVSSYSYWMVSFDAGNAHYGDDGEKKRGYVYLIKN